MATAADNILEQFDRYVLIARIKLNADPTEATEKAVQRFLDQHPSPRIDRYLDLLDASEAVASKGYKPEVAKDLGPSAFLAGADRDLAELCIDRR